LKLGSGEKIKSDLGETVQKTESKLRKKGKRGRTDGRIRGGHSQISNRGGVITKGGRGEGNDRTKMAER